MAIRDLHEMPWIGTDHPVLDLSNTVVVGAGPRRGDIDFFADPDLTERWRARATDRDLAALPLRELDRLRGLVRAALDAVADREPLPDDLRRTLNGLAASAPVTLELTADGTIEHRERGGDADAVIARQTLLLAADPDPRRRVRRCGAPSCGMFFRPRRGDQTWCSVGCGNRARSVRRQRIRG